MSEDVVTYDVTEFDIISRIGNNLLTIKKVTGVKDKVFAHFISSDGEVEIVCPFNANVPMYSPTYGECLAPTAVGIKINGWECRLTK